MFKHPKSVRRFKYSLFYRWIPIIRHILAVVGQTHLSFTLRRLDLPVGPNDKVLEIGSGDNPYPRANVLVDRYEANLERWDDLNRSRPLVIADAGRLPFASKSFDYVVASHVLEHMTDPGAFLEELQRVASAGYIETPHGFMERIIPYPYHRLLIRGEGNTLVITKKSCSNPDPDLVDDFRAQFGRSGAFRKVLHHRPDLFYFCFRWQGKINYRIVNPEIDCTWQTPLVSISPPPPGRRSVLRKTIVSAIRRALEM